MKQQLKRMSVCPDPTAEKQNNVKTHSVKPLKWLYFSEEDKLALILYIGNEWSNSEKGFGTESEPEDGSWVWLCTGLVGRGMFVR